MLKFKKAISLFLAMAITISLFSFSAFAQVNETTSSLKFNTDGSFKIVHICDIQDTSYLAPAVIDYITAICESEKPDLVVLGGDNIAKSTGKAATKTIAKLQVIKGINNYMSVFEKLNIPVAIVFGNHDGEKLISKEEQMKMYSKYKCNLSIDEGEDVSGCGNYNIPIMSSDGSKMKYNLWFLDSNSYDTVNSGYDYVHQDEVDWYVKKSNELKTLNGGVSVPSMVFQHIIVNDVFDAIENNEIVTGSVNETPNASAVRGSEFETMVSQGDVKVMFFGHDHENTYTARHKGIDLVATPAAGFTLSSDVRGVRVINLNENDLSTYDTHLINYKEAFCNNKMEYDRYMMNSNEIGTKEQASYGVRYFALALLNKVSICKLIYEVICILM